MYAQPPAQAQATPESPYGTPQPFTAPEAIGAAWEHFKKQAGLLIGAAVLFIVPCVVLAYVPTTLMMAQVVTPNSVEFHGATLAISIIIQILGAYFGVGFARLGLAIVRGEPASFGYLFAGKGFGRFLVLSLILAIPGWLGSGLNIVGAAIDEPVMHIVSLGWSVLWLVPAIFIWLPISQSAYFMFDKDLSIGKAIRASIEVTRGRRLDIFLASLLAGLIGCAGMFACCIGALGTIPLAMMVFPVIYARLTGQDPNPGGGYGGGYAQPVYYPPQGQGFGGAPPPAGGYGSPPPGGYGQPPGY